ncbi:MAG: EamA family transporter [Eubacteriales bacterium]|nr:EamA family transporter [Eubacteriales bacterium]
MQSKTKGPLLIAVTAVLWSFGGLLIKLIPWNAMTIVGIRAVFAGAVMTIYMRRPRITFSLPVILGALSLSGTTILYVFANKLTTAANAIVLQYTAPIFVVILSVMFFKKKAKTVDIIAVLIVFAGMALFFFDKLQINAMLGNILACLSGITFAGVFLINQMPDSKPEEALLLGHIINVVISIPFIAGNITWEPIAWISVTLLGIFQLGLAYVLFSIGIKNTPPIAASLIATLEPLLNPVWVLLFSGEKPGNWALVGGVIVLVTVVVYNIVTSKQNRKELKLLREEKSIAPPLE